MWYIIWCSIVCLICCDPLLNKLLKLLILTSHCLIGVQRPVREKDSVVWYCAFSLPTAWASTWPFTGIPAHSLCVGIRGDVRSNRLPLSNTVPILSQFTLYSCRDLEGFPWNVGFTEHDRIWRHRLICRMKTLSWTFSKN